MAKGSLGIGSHKTPTGACGGLLHLHLVAGRKDVGVRRLERNGLFLAVLFPRNRLQMEIEGSILGNIEDVGIGLVDRIPVFLDIDLVAHSFDHLVEAVIDLPAKITERKALSKIETRKYESTAGMLLLCEAVEIGSITDLGFDLLFAIPKVVVRNESDHDSILIPTGKLEGGSIVVALVLRFPAHPVLLLLLRGLRDVRQAHILLFHRGEVRRENDAPRMPRPVLDIETSIVLRQKGISCVAKNRFHEIEITDEVARHEKTGLHRFLRRETGNLRTDHRSKHERNKGVHRLFFLRGKRNREETLGRIQGRLQHVSKCLAWHGAFVRSNGEPSLGDMEHPFCGSPVLCRIVADTLPGPKTGHDIRLESITIRRKRKKSRKTMTLEHQRIR